MPAAEAGIPVSVLTGFLGSGKTTVLNGLLGDPEAARTAVIVNELGEVGIDHDLVERSSDDVVLLNAGCLCCAVRGDLVDSLRRLFLRRVRGEVPAFERVVIETTGLADPAPVLHTLMTEPLLAARYRLDGVIATVDAVVGAETLDRHPEAAKQVAIADRLLVTKTDLVAEDRVAGLEARVRSLNPRMPLLRVCHGRVAAADVFGAGLYNPAAGRADVTGWLGADGDESAGPHHHGHGITARCLVREAPLRAEALEEWLEALAAARGPDLLRVKGIVNVAGLDGPVVVHGVQHVFHPPARLAAWPSADRRTRFVLITRNLGLEALRQLLEHFDTGADATAGGEER